MRQPVTSTHRQVSMQLLLSQMQRTMKCEREGLSLVPDAVRTTSTSNTQDRLGAAGTLLSALAEEGSADTSADVSVATG